MGDPDEKDGERTRPIPVRKSVGETPHPAGGRPTPPVPGESRRSGRRPTPVRQALPDRQEAVPELPEAPPVRIERGDEVWHARVIGRTVTGAPRDPGAPLLLVAFSPGEADADPTREAIVVGGELEAFSELRLLELLDASRPYRGRKEPEDIFSDTRKGRGGR